MSWLQRMKEYEIDRTERAKYLGTLCNITLLFVPYTIGSVVLIYKTMSICAPILVFNCGYMGSQASMDLKIEANEARYAANRFKDYQKRVIACPEKEGDIAHEMIWAERIRPRMDW
jgi:hypothetical protein